jgi:predicted ribosome quality control (RQC) complex YloA/Tae2 family protein
MPFDAIVTKCIADELKNIIMTGRIDKIHQPEKDEINISLRAKGKNLKLLLSSNSSYPRVHITSITKKNPIKAPLFCMILRKHLVGARIVNIEFLDYERIIKIQFENTTELGDLSIKNLYIEIMGRHSNIILANSNNKIIDSIKHIDEEISSKREIMPARNYELPPKQNKISPDNKNIYKIFEKNYIIENESLETPLSKYLLYNIKGFSPILCNYICDISKIDKNINLKNIEENHLIKLKTNFDMIMDKIKSNKFNPILFMKNDLPKDFYCLDISLKQKTKSFDTLSSLLDFYYSERDKIIHLNQKKYNLNKILTNNIQRCKKKISIHKKIINKSKNNENYKLYGELLLANLYSISKNAEKVSLLNYYSEKNEYLDIKLKSHLTPQENAQIYFKKYTKSKTAISESKKQLKIAENELDYLESVLHNLEIAATLEEINEINEELIHQKYILINNKKKKNKFSPTKPHKFKSSDGYEIFVGKNNFQNDLLTLKMSSSNDMWLHTKEIHGSHVVIKTNNNQNVPDNTLLEAANLSAYYSKARLSSNVPVDYTKIKNVKKPSGAKPGMVIYVNYKTIYITPNENLIEKLKV